MIELSALGWSQLAIKRELRIDLKTIRKWLKDKHSGTWQRMVYKPNPADAYHDFLCQRWKQGCRNASQLYLEVGEKGYRGPAKAFRQWVKERLRDEIPS